MLRGQNDNQNHIKSVLSRMLNLPGYIDDVARHMITLAKESGQNEPIECTYGKIILRARSDSTVDEIRRSYERQCIPRRSLRLRLVS